MIERGISDPESEDKIISTLWNDTESRQFFPKLFAQVFYVVKNEKIFHAMKLMYDNREPFEASILESKLKDLMPYSDVIGLYMLNHRLEPEALLWHIEHVKFLYVIRLGYRINTKSAELLAQHDINRVMRLGESFRTIHQHVFRKTEPTSFDKLNKLMGGWTRGDISSVGGKSGHNKTTFVLYDAVQSLKNDPSMVLLYVAVDEPGEMIARRIIASEMGLSLSGMRQKTVKVEPSEIVSAMHQLFGKRLVILDNINNADTIVTAIQDYLPTRTIVDHIQELNYGDDGISDQKVTVACGKLKAAAKLTHSNVTVVSQVRDKLIDERFEDKVPRPHDFLYASDLRRKSREQAVVYWKFKDSQDEFDMQIFDLILWKSTYSGTGKATFIVDPDKARFYEKAITVQAIDKPKTAEDVWKKI
jgi:replicative DNA helicase